MKYTFDLNVILVTTVTVEADSYEEALEKAEEAAPSDYNEWDKVGSAILDSEDEED